MDGMHVDPSSWHIDRPNRPCRGAEISSGLASLWTPATSARKMPPNFQARTWGNLTELRIWEYGSTDVSWAYILNCLWKRVQLSSFDTVSGNSVSSMFCCTVGTHQRARCQCWKTSVPARENHVLRKQSLCDLVIVRVVSHQPVVIFLNHVIYYFLLPAPHPRKYFFGFCLHYFSFNVSKIFKKKCWKEKSGAPF